jgi:hypothetical protein
VDSECRFKAPSIAYARLQGELETAKVATDLDVKVQEFTRKLEASPAFADELDRVREIPELGGNIQKGGARYYGITVGDVPKLPSE